MEKAERGFNFMRKNNGSLILSVLAGAAVGALTAMLFAPKSGKDLRKDIKDEADKAIDTAEDYVGVAKDKGADVLGTAQEAGSDMMQNRNKAIHKISNQVGRAVDRAEDGLTETAKYNLQQAADTHKQARERSKEIAKDTAEDVKDTAVEAKHEFEEQ